MALLGTALTKKNGTLSFGELDAFNFATGAATGGGEEIIVIEYTDGDLSFDDPGTNVVSLKPRGKKQNPPILRYSEEGDITGTFTCYLREALNAAEASKLGLMLQTGFVASDWVSSGGTTADVFTVQMNWALAASALGGTDRFVMGKYVELKGSLDESGDFIKLSFSFTIHDQSITVI